MKATKKMKEMIPKIETYTIEKSISKFEAATIHNTASEYFPSFKNHSSN